MNQLNFWETKEFNEFLNQKLHENDLIFIKEFKKKRGILLFLVYSHARARNNLLKIYLPSHAQETGNVFNEIKKILNIKHENIIEIFQTGVWNYENDELRYEVQEFFEDSLNLNEFSISLIDERSFNEIGRAHV